MTRDELQATAVSRLKTYKRLICQWATGVGKTCVALKFLQDNPDATTLILVPEQNNIQNWLDEFRKFQVPTDKVTVSCYASFKKYVNTSWDLLVFDEMPHVDTEKRKAICRSVKGEYILALGAVIDEDERFALESVYGRFYKSIIGLSHAINNGILPSPTIYVFHLRLDDTFRKHVVVGRLLTTKEYYDYIQQKVSKAVNDFEKSPSVFNKNKMLRVGNERKRLLGQWKDDALVAICHELEENGTRFICFCSSISQTVKVGGDRSFTSKTPASARLLDRFNDKEINSLYVVGKLIEGQNLKDIECGVIGQLGGTQRITVQECGRIMRSENPVIYIPIFDGTKDEAFLRTLTNNIPNEYIKHYNYKVKN